MNFLQHDELINRYLLAAAEHWESFKAHGLDRSAVRRGNQAADDMRRLATEIGAAGSAAMQAFGRLLDEPRNGVQGWAAFHVLEVMQAPADLVDRALRVLEMIASSDGLHALGTRSRLKELRSQYGR
jgi:hypothetical protein